MKKMNSLISDKLPPVIHSPNFFIADFFILNLPVKTRRSYEGIKNHKLNTT